MKRFYRHTTYKTDHLSLEDKIDLLKDAKEASYSWQIDILDCNVSFARQKIEMEFEEALKKCSTESFLSVIHRRGYEERKWHLEVCLSTMTSPDYFLWIFVPEDKIEELVNKYNLKVMQ